MVKRTEAIASEIVKHRPDARMTLGAVAFGWSEFMSLSDAPDAKEHNAKYGTYLDFFLASMKAAGDEAQEAAGARAGRPLVPGGARHQAHHREGHVAEDGRGAAAGAAQPVGPDVHGEELDHRHVGQADPADPVAARAHRGALPGHEAGDDRIQLRRRRPHLGRAGAGRRARHLRARGPLPGQLLGRRPRQRQPARRTSRRPSACTATTTASAGTFGDTAVAATPADIAKASIYAATDTKQQGHADDPGHQQGAAVDLQRQDRHQGAASAPRRRSTRSTAAAPTSSRRRRST